MVAVLRAAAGLEAFARVEVAFFAVGALGGGLLGPRTGRTLRRASRSLRRAVVGPLAGQDALSCVGNRFRDQRAELRSIRNHRCSCCLRSIRRVEPCVADLPARGRAGADCCCRSGEAGCEHFTTHCRLGEFVERVVTRRSLALAGFGHCNPSFRSCPKTLQLPYGSVSATNRVCNYEGFGCPRTLKGRRQSNDPLEHGQRPEVKAVCPALRPTDTLSDLSC